MWAPGLPRFGRGTEIPGTPRATTRWRAGKPGDRTVRAQDLPGSEARTQEFRTYGAWDL